MKKYVLTALILLSFSLNAVKADIKVSDSGGGIGIVLSISDFISEDIYSSLRSGERISFSVRLFSKGLLKNREYARERCEFHFDPINKIYILEKNGNETIFYDYEKLLNALREHRLDVSKEVYGNKKLWINVNIKGMNVVGLFALVYKIFFKLDYDLLIEVPGKA